MNQETKNKIRNNESLQFILNFIIFTFGCISLVVGVRHYDFFGLTWKSLLVIILGTIILYLYFLGALNKVVPVKVKLGIVNVNKQ